MTWSATVIFCDDIRQEMNGKFLIVGAYTSEISTQNPLYMVLGTYIPLTGLEKGLHSYRCSVWQTYNREAVSEREFLGENLGHLEITRPDLSALICPTGLGVNITSDCLIEVDLAFDDEESRTIGSIPVRISSLDGELAIRSEGSEAD